MKSLMKENYEKLKLVYFIFFIYEIFLSELVQISEEILKYQGLRFQDSILKLEK